jgi:tRNA dimethylallyltransferase
MSLIEFPNGYSDNTKQNSLIPLVVIIGPTAVGKTEISIQLAERFNGEIVSADSRLFYRGMNIGTAKPTIEDRLRVTHHLIDVANPDEIWSLALFQTEANKAIRDIHLKQHLPFLVGGTGQFIRSIIEGWSVPPVEPNPRLREALTLWSKNIGPTQFHNKLTILDPQAARSIDPTNVRRTIRALEVIYSTGIRFSEQKKSGDIHYHSLILGLTCSRVDLYQRIDERISSMIEAGFVEEVQRLLDQGYSAELPTMSAIGYREIVSFIQGKISLDDAITLMKRRTRDFVRRQANWFKESDPQINWFTTGKETVDAMGELIIKWLTALN